MAVARKAKKKLRKKTRSKKSDVAPRYPRCDDGNGGPKKKK
jgi:hypothetical protein